VAGPEGGRRAVIAALLANAGIALAKFVGFLITGSSAMLAEAVHSVADTGNQGLLLLGGWSARRKATPDHPFGYGRDRFFWAFLVAVILFTLGGVFAIYEGVHKLQHPEDITSPAVALAILGVAIVLEIFSFRTAIVEANKIRAGSNWVQFVRRTKSAELAVVLMEDLGALVGLMLALTGVSLALATGDPRWDGYASIAIGVLLGLIAVTLGVEMRSLLIGESASSRDIEAINGAIAATPGVGRAVHMRTQHLGPEELLVAVKVTLEPDVTMRDLAKAINDCEAAIRAAVPAARVIYIEPDLFTPPAPAAPAPAPGPAGPASHP
jgi:cation diffusion facilitator family transporter